jgi:hypothetical protein
LSASGGLYGRGIRMNEERSGCSRAAASWTETTTFRAVRCCAALALVGAICPSPAGAQALFDRDLSADVLTRPHPEYDPLGIRIDSFIVYPKLDLGLTLDDNIFGLPDKTSDLVGVIKPSLSVVSDWGRNQLQASFSSEFDEYADHGNESSEQYVGTVSGRIDVNHASQITFLGSGALLTEPRTAPDSVAALNQPVQYTEGKLFASDYIAFNKLKIEGNLSFTSFDYDNVTLSNGQIYDEQSRNENSFSETIRADYAISPSLAAFVSATPNQNVFEQKSTPTQPGFDSSGVSVLAGMNFQITHLMTGEIGFGGYNQDYDDKRFSSVSGFDYNGLVKYYPTDLLTITVKAKHTVAPSGIPESPSTYVNEATIGADYELLRNLILSATGDFSSYQYPGLSRTDDRYSAGLQARYYLNRGASVNLHYNYLDQESTGSGRGFNFTDNQIGFSLTLQR